MRFEVILTRETNSIDKDYRRIILSIIKVVLENNKLKDKYFGKYKKKNYTFNVSMDVDNIVDDVINLKTNIIKLEFSFLDKEMFDDYYNSFKKMLHKTVKYMNITHINNIRCNKLTNFKDGDILNIRFDIKSPIMVRSKISTGKDWYYTNDNIEYCEIINRNLKTLLNIDSNDDLIKIMFHKSKKIVVSFYEYKIPTNIGTLSIIGKKEILEYIYKTGLGSRTSCGFGMLDILEVGKVENN